MNFLFANFTQVLKRFKTSSFINIMGLSVALMVFFVVLMQVYYDFTFDKGYKNADKIVQLNVYDYNTERTAANLNFQIPVRISNNFPEVEAFCVFNDWGVRKFDIDKENKLPETYDISIALTTQGFLQVFTPGIIMGDTAGIFSSPGHAMLSEKTAKRLFGNENPIGKVIRNHFGKEQLTVQAVYSDFPENSSLGNGIYSYLPEDETGDWNFQSYFLVQHSHLKELNQKMNTAKALGEDYIKFLEQHPEMHIQVRLSSMNDLYLYDYKHINIAFPLLTIGVIVLLIAFVNFVNLSLAMAPLRIRGINIHKILGINKTTLRLIITMESVMFTLLALIIAFFGIHLLRGSIFAQDFFPVIGVSLKSYIGLLVTASIVVLLFAFAIGLHTMRFSTSVPESEVLKASFATGVKGIRLRNILIVIQFTIAIILICVSIFIKAQNDYMLNYDGGIQRKNVVYLPIAGLGKSAEPFGQELLRDMHITDYCLTRFLPGQIGLGWGREFEGKFINLRIWPVDDRFFDFFNIQITAGRKPEQMDSVISQLVVNETFLDKYDLDESIVGKDLRANAPGRIEAVAKNVNFESLRDSIRPMAFCVLLNWQDFKYMMIKLNGKEVPSAIKSIEQTWNKFSKDPFELHFADEEIDNLYRKEINMAKQIGLFGILIVIIAVMGVYGMIVFNARYKAKEIAIRKVNGSTVWEIILMLNRNVLILLGIAYLIAGPVVWFITKKWLEFFAYKIPVYWWVFLWGGLIVLLIALLTVCEQSYRAAVKNPTKTLNME